jgi:hypothetical protein
VCFPGKLGTGLLRRSACKIAIFSTMNIGEAEEIGFGQKRRKKDLQKGAK